MLQLFLNVTEIAYRALRVTSVLVIAFYFVLVVLQVLFRYVLNESLFWSEELVRYGMVWGVMLGSAIVARDRAHIRIEVIESYLPPAAKYGLQFVANSLSFCFCVILCWTGVDFVDRTWFQNSASLGVPMRAVYLAIPIGAGIEAWFTAAAWLRGEDSEVATNEAIV